MSRLRALPRGLRADRRGASDILPALASVAIVIVCAGLVLAAVQAASAAAAGRTAHARAAQQAEVVLDALPRDPALSAGDGRIDWARGEWVAAGSAHLRFVPAPVRVLMVRPASEGTELFLFGSNETLSPALVFVTHPAALVMPSGETVPGVLKVGVAVE